jgi:hypothetical protein
MLSLLMAELLGMQLQLFELLLLLEGLLWMLLNLQLLLASCRCDYCSCRYCWGRTMIFLFYPVLSPALLFCNFRPTLAGR